jgi:hypothetical protein
VSSCKCGTAILLIIVVIVAYIFLFLLVPTFIMAYKSSDGCRYNGF